MLQRKMKIKELLKKQRDREKKGKIKIKSRHSQKHHMFGMHEAMSF